MKRMKKLLAFGTALCLLFALAACNSSSPSGDSSAAPSEETKQNEPETDAGMAGTYRFDYTDAYGDITTFTVTLKEDGTFTLMTLGALGNGVYSGAGWTDNGDGTFTTGATDPALSIDWAEADGSATWIVDGANAAPVSYEAPTEFLDKAAFSDPTIGAEAVGIYLFGEVNERGSTVPYGIWVNADGTYVIYMNNSFTGLHAYSGDSWTINGDSIISFGPATFEGDAPMGTWFDADNGYTSSWKLHGDGTCEALNYDGGSTSVSSSDLPEEVYPAGGEYVGVYTFGEVNERGSTVPYSMWVNADGTINIFMNNSFTGLHEYDGEWTYEGDGVISVGPLTYEGDEPMGTWFDSGNGFSSSYTLNADGTFSPMNYTGGSTSIDVSTLPAEIYPLYTSLAGTYYFGEVNDHGSTVPYAVVLKDSGSALVLMDNSFTGVHAYTGDWTDNGDGTISIGALTYEGDDPMGTWFDGDNGFSSSWRVSAGVCSPMNYDGASTTISSDAFSEEALNAIAAF